MGILKKYAVGLASALSLTVAQGIAQNTLIGNWTSTQYVLLPLNGVISSEYHALENVFDSGVSLSFHNDTLVSYKTKDETADQLYEVLGDSIFFYEQRNQRVSESTLSLKAHLTRSENTLVLEYFEQDILVKLTLSKQP